MDPSKITSKWTKNLNFITKNDGLLLLLREKLLDDSRMKHKNDLISHFTQEMSTHEYLNKKNLSNPNELTC